MRFLNALGYLGLWVCVVYGFIKFSMREEKSTSFSELCENLESEQWTLNGGEMKWLNLRKKFRLEEVRNPLIETGYSETKNKYFIKALKEGQTEAKLFFVKKPKCFVNLKIKIDGKEIRKKAKVDLKNHKKTYLVFARS